MLTLILSISFHPANESDTILRGCGKIKARKNCMHDGEWHLIKKKDRKTALTVKRHAF
jgi:hypothetical protein